MYIPVSVVSVSLCFVEAIVASPEEEDDHLKRFFTHNRNMPKKPWNLSCTYLGLWKYISACTQTARANTRTASFMASSYRFAFGLRVLEGAFQPHKWTVRLVEAIFRAWNFRLFGKECANLHQTRPHFFLIQKQVRHLIVRHSLLRGTFSSAGTCCSPPGREAIQARRIKAEKWQLHFVFSVCAPCYLWLYVTRTCTTRGAATTD